MPLRTRQQTSAGTYTLFSTEMGWMGLASTDRGVFASTLPQPSREEAEAELLLRFPFQPAYNPESFRDLEKNIRAYFTGVPLTVNCKLDWSWATPFQQRVLEVVMGISAGSWLSYGQVAGLAGSPGGARAVGGALSSNMIPIIIPCHRVIRSNGSLGGFTGASPDIKARLLSLEGASFS